MNQDVIIFVCYQRPELAVLALEHLAECPEAKECDLEIWIDNHIGNPPHPDIWKVIEGFLFPSVPSVSLMSAHTVAGMNLVTPEALKQAYQSKYRYVFVLEEDIMVTPDWIRWSRAAHQTFHPLVSYGQSAQSRHPDPTLCVIQEWFCAWGACFSREKMEPIVRHFNADLYSNPLAYQQKELPEQFKTHNVLAWDGLLTNIMRRDHLKSVCPLMARCFHAGVWGFHRNPKSPLADGSLGDRIREMREHLYDSKWMTAEHYDCLPCSMNIPEWNELRIVQ